MVWYWVFVLALSILLYLLLDGFDLGIGILFGLTRDEAKRRGMMAAVAPDKGRPQRHVRSSI
jgi:cytochrome bd ubiquinol oxidase subunit II